MFIFVYWCVGALYIFLLDHKTYDLPSELRGPLGKIHSLLSIYIFFVRSWHIYCCNIFCSKTRNKILLYVHCVTPKLLLLHVYFLCVCSSKLGDEFDSNADFLLYHIFGLFGHFNLLCISVTV